MQSTISSFSAAWSALEVVLKQSQQFEIGLEIGVDTVYKQSELLCEVLLKQSQTCLEEVWKTPGSSEVVSNLSQVDIDAVLSLLSTIEVILKSFAVAFK